MNQIKQRYPRDVISSKTKILWKFIATTSLKHEIVRVREVLPKEIMEVTKFPNFSYQDTSIHLITLYG